MAGELNEKLANAPQTLIIACGALARELKTLIALNGWSHVKLACLPAGLHNRPDRITAAVRAKIYAARQQFAKILCLYGDCGTGGKLDAMLASEGVERIEGAHCYAFFTGLEAFDALAEAEPGTFYLTDYLVRHFDRLVIRGLGLDRHPELHAAYFGNYSRVLYLAQIPDPALEAKARLAAAQLQLPLEMRFSGLGSIERYLAGAIATQGALHG